LRHSETMTAAMTQVPKRADPFRSCNRDLDGATFCLKACAFMIAGRVSSGAAHMSEKEKTAD